MCGFVVVHSPGAAIRPEIVSQGVEALAHRGPDGRGTWHSPHLSLGHTRLSLVDPEAEQPIVSEDGRLHIVVNGEFYDDARIRRDLLRRGHVLRTRSDSEIALHLYEDLGEGCLDDLRGEFAFAIWDDHNKILFAARDRFGVKPLFYAQIGTAIYLASEVGALFAMGVPAVWDHEAIYQALHGCFDPHRTLFAGIRQVPPAHKLIVTAKDVRIERYWDIPYSTRDGAEAPDDEGEEGLVSRVRELLDESVRLRLRGDVPIGCLLSGGLDSSAVLGLMARNADYPVATFTVAFEDLDCRGYDESEIALATSARVGAVPHVLRLTDRDLADHFDEATRSGEAMLFNGHGVARFLLSRFVREAGYRGVMGGEGADELFAGYAFLRESGQVSSRSSWLGSFARLMRLAKPALATHTRIGQTSPWLSRVTRLIGVPSVAVGALADRFDLVRSVLSLDLRAEMRDFDPCQQLHRSLDLPTSFRRWEPLQQVTYVWLRSLFAGYHMASDRLDMAHAVEVRLPFLDHKLFEFACQIPSAIHTRKNKHVLREAARAVVPENVYHGVKRPFVAPPAVTIDGNPMHDMVQDALRARTPSFVDRDGVVRLLDNLPNTAPSALSSNETLLLALTSLNVLGARYSVGDA